jgi:Tol biopolymer transport system component
MRLVASVLVLAGFAVVVSAARTAHQAITSETSPAWSPDGRKLTFSRGQIYTMNVVGTGLRQLTRLRRGAGVPDWGPR